MTTRRDFLSLGALSAAGLGLSDREAHADTAEQVKQLKPPTKPVLVTRVTGDQSVQEAYQMLLDGTDTLEAAHHICVGRENDPHDHSVGLGGLPNEEGVVELDSCCMHGPSRRAGSVGGVRNIKNVSLVARKIWMLWKESNSQMDWWGPGMADPAWKDPFADKPAPNPTIDLHGLSSLRPDLLRPGSIPRHPTPEWEATIRARTKKLTEMAVDLGIEPEQRLLAAEQVLWPTTGTIHVSAVNTKGEISGTTTTSGLAWKLPGRLGDSPILGAGSYTDQDVGSAGATGSGEENIKVAGAHTIVELMRQGSSPKEAGMETLRRIVRNYNGDMKKIRYLDMEYYIVRKDGAYAGCSLWSSGATGKPRVFVVHDGTYRVEKCAALFEGSPTEWPPF